MQQIKQKHIPSDSSVCIGQPFFGQMPRSEGIVTNSTMADFWIKHEWYKTMKDGNIKLTRADWRMGESIRQDAIKFLVEKVLTKDPLDITNEDFYSNRLSGLLTNYYNCSSYNALKDAGYDFHPWEMIQTPHKFYNCKKNRVAATPGLSTNLRKTRET
jgi:hypothetical protein